MELKSNIKIKSNLYIRSTADGSFSFADEDYIAHITNRAALKALMDRAVRSGVELKLSDAQKNILDPRFARTGSLGGEMPSVAPKITAPPIEIPAVAPKPGASTAPVTEASRIEPIVDTSAVPITEAPVIEPIADTSAAPITEAPVIEPIADTSAAPVTEAPVIEPIVDTSAAPVTEAPVILLEKLNVGLDEFSELNSSEINARIIESSLDSKVILDGLNYSEMIRIAAERAAYIMKNDPEKRVLVLCGTDVAAERIKRRAEKLSSGSHIDMLDVFAAKYLSVLGESAARITALSEHEKITMFSDRMRTEDFAKYDYCLISDLDELVAEHVKVILKILVLLKCGFLLLTDRRRAALKYTPDSGYSKNFGKLWDVLPESTEKLTLGSVKHVLSDEIDGIISAMAEGIPSSKACADLLSKMESKEISALADADGETVVLCRDRGSVEYVSLVLHQKNIPHTVLRGDKPSSVRQLADILWDSHEKIIGRDNFVKRFIARCGGDDISAGEYFNKLCALTEQDPLNGLELAKLAEVISLGGIPLYMLNVLNDRLAVTEIGSQYGRVFNKVYLIDKDFSGDFDDPANAKLLYLAAAGRTDPPAVLKLGGDMPDTACSSGNRWMHIGGDGKAAFGAGYPEDTDLSSFIDGSVGDAVRKQAYISKNVKPGDSVALRLNGKVYDIVHNSTVIGRTSAAFSDHLGSEFGGRRYFDSLPEQIAGIYVTDVITVVSCRDSAGETVSPQFRSHRFWYGVELSGFGKIE